MQSFVDNAGRTWEIAINVATVRKLRGSPLKLDLMQVVANGADGLGKLLGDPVTFVDMLYVICQEQADKHGISDEDFGRAMAGDAIQQAAEMWLEELISFFPEKKARENLRLLIEKSKTVGSLMLDQMASQVESLNPETIATALTKSLTSVPVSVESSPAPSLSENFAA